MPNIIEENGWVKLNLINVAKNEGKIKSTLTRKVLPQYLCLSLRLSIFANFSSSAKRKYSGF